MSGTSTHDEKANRFVGPGLAPAGAGSGGAVLRNGICLGAGGAAAVRDAAAGLLWFELRPAGEAAPVPEPAHLHGEENRRVRHG